jgi:hypothetical protein
MQGWAFKLGQINIVSDQAESLDRVSNDDGSLVLPVQKSFVNYDGNQLSGDMDKRILVFLCTRWNQGCFDLAFVFGSELVTANFTISAEHSLNIWFIRDLKDALERGGRTIDKVTHLIVVDTAATSENFKFKDVSGTGSGTGKPLYTIKTAVATQFVSRGVSPIQTMQAVDGTSYQGDTSPVVARLGRELNQIFVYQNRTG